MSVDIRIFVDVVALILDYFCEIIKATKCNDQPYFDIELSKENDFNIINVTNCNCGDGDFSAVFVDYFNELCTQIKFDDYFKAITIFVKLSNGEEAAYDFQYSENRVNRICSRHMNAQESRRFAHLNEYQSFMLNSTLPSEDIAKFAEYVSRGIDLHESSLNSKYTFRYDKETIYQNHVISEKDMINCKIMSLAIKKIIKKTTNDEFRQRCFSLLDKSTSLKTGDDVLNKFVSLLARQKNMEEDKFSTFQKHHRSSKTNKTCREKNEIYEISSDTDNDEENTRADENKEPNIVSSKSVTSRGRRIKRTKLCGAA